MGASLFVSIGLLILALYLTYLYEVRETFIGDPNAQQCGVDQPPCPFGTACMNGWCVENAPPQLPATTGLPVLP